MLDSPYSYRPSEESLIGLFMYILSLGTRNDPLSNPNFKSQIA